MTRWSFLLLPDTSEVPGRSTQLGVNAIPDYLVSHGMPWRGSHSKHVSLVGFTHPSGPKLEMSSPRGSCPAPDPPLRRRKRNSYPKQGEGGRSRPAASQGHDWWGRPEVLLESHDWLRKEKLRLTAALIGSWGWCSLIGGRQPAPAGPRLNWSCWRLGPFSSLGRPQFCWPWPACQ